MERRLPIGIRSTTLQNEDSVNALWRPVSIVEIKVCERRWANSSYITAARL